MKESNPVVDSDITWALSSQDLKELSRDLQELLQDLKESSGYRDSEIAPIYARLFTQ